MNTLRLLASHVTHSDNMKDEKNSPPPRFARWLVTLTELRSHDHFLFSLITIQSGKESERLRSGCQLVAAQRRKEAFRFAQCKD